MKLENYDINKKLKILKKDGIVFFENYLSEKKCEYFKNKINKILKNKVKLNEYVGNSSYQVIENYFSYSNDFFSLIYSDLINKVMTNLIDKDFVMISSSARNSQINKNIKKEHKTSGIGWHTDTRYIQNKKITPSLIYTSLITLDDFTSKNGTTKYFPGSNKINVKPQRDQSSKNSKILKAKKGTLVIFDTALWHKAGDARLDSRWGIFTMYAPWFMKPYFQFDKIIEKKKLYSLDPKIRQLLHFDSTPPQKHDEKNLATLKRIRDELYKNTK